METDTTAAEKRLERYVSVDSWRRVIWLTKRQMMKPCVVSQALPYVSDPRQTAEPQWVKNCN